MKPDPADLKAIIGLPPAEAIAYLQGKGYRIAWDWQETLDEVHARAFTVAKVARLDVLQDIKAALDKALAEGMTLQQFQGGLTPILQAKGWWGKQIIVDSQGGAEVAQLGSPRRLQTIYQTNLQSAYMAGRYKGMKASVGTHPYWQYIAVLDGRTRPSHRAMNKRVFRHDDPIWETCYPPNGFNCRCRVRPVSKVALDGEGLHLESSEGRLSTITVETGTNKRTGEVYEATRTGIKVTGDGGRTHWFAPDAGFNSNPGATRFQPDLDKYDYQTARQYVSETLRGPDFAGWYHDLAAVVARGLAEGGSSAELRQALAAGQRFPIAVLDGDGMAKLGSQSQTVWLSDDTLAKQLVHRQGQNVGLEDYWRVQEVLESPQMIIADRELHLKFIRQDGKWWVAVVKVTRSGKENWLQSFYVTTEKEVRRLMRSGAVIEGGV